MSHPQAEELMKQQRAADKEDRERGEAFKSLVKHPGWAMFTGLINSRIQASAELLMEPVEKLIPEGTNTEYLKGTMRGLIMARDLPSATIAGMEQLTSDPAQGDEE